MGNIRSARVFTPIVIARRSATLALVNATSNNIVFDVEDLDVYNSWNGTTFTAPVAGLYKFDLMVFIQATGTMTAVDIFSDITINGASATTNRFGDRFSGSTPANAHISPTLPTISLSASDAVIFRVTPSFTGSTAVSIPVSTYTSLVINLLR